MANFVEIYLDYPWFKLHYLRGFIQLADHSIKSHQIINTVQFDQFQIQIISTKINDIINISVVS